MVARTADIVAAVGQAADGSSRVQRDIGEVTDVAQSTSASSEQVSASTQQTSAATQQIAAAAQELSARADELEQLVGRFTLSA
jgi:methyl-accepting chemotaxis protein